MGLVRDQILVPTKDAPELAYVIESTEDRYVPDVFFTEMDKYKNEIKKIGRPLPVEYLLIDLTVSTPLQPLSTFSVFTGDKKHFPVENRLLDSSLQVDTKGYSYQTTITHVIRISMPGRGTGPSSDLQSSFPQSLIFTCSCSWRLMKFYP